MNQSKKGTSLSNTRLSAHAKPFTINPSTSVHSSDHSNGYGMKGVDFHENLSGKGNDGGGSVDDGSMLQQGKQSVDGLKNTSIAVADGILNKSIGTTWGKDNVSNCIGTIHTADESSSFLMPNYKLNPIKVTAMDSSYCLDRSLEHPKGLGVTSIKTLAVPHELYLQNDYVQKSSIPKLFAQAGQNSFASSSDQCTEIGNDIAQFIRRSLGKIPEIEKQMPLEASLFRSLWLDCEAERCYKRYKTYRCLMEAGIDVNYTNVEELWK